MLRLPFGGMIEARRLRLAKPTVDQCLVGAVVGACAIDFGDSLAAARELSKTMAPLWDYAYRRNLSESLVSASRSLSTASPCERVLAHACFGLATLCDEEVLRSAVDDLVHADATTLRAKVDGVGVADHHPTV